jgi:glutamate-1-semialdehyde 2,1-aminomutase
VTATYNDVDGVGRLLDEHEVAAVLVEPLQGSAGCIPADRDFLRTLRRECDRTGALLIFDEVMTSRLSPGGAQAVHGVLPDLTTLGKYLAGGFSFGAFGGRRELMAAFDPSAGGRLGHAGTFNNNVVSMAAGIATLTEVLTPEILAATNARGDQLRAGLDAAFRAYDLPMSVSGFGSLMNIHGTPGPVCSVDDLRGSNDAWKELLFFAALDAGFFIARRGFIALSIEVTDDDVSSFVAFVDRWAAGATALRGSACA